MSSSSTNEPIATPTAPAPPLRSIIIAGATGAIGREVVRLAINNNTAATATTANNANSASSNYVFDRVVALSRRDIPQEEWPTVFPGIDMAKALAPQSSSPSSAPRLVVQAVPWEELTKARLQRKDGGSSPATADAHPATSTTETSTTPASTSSGSIYPAYFGGHQIAVMTMGTTKKDAGSTDAFRRVDLDYTGTFAEAVYELNNTTNKNNNNSQQPIPQQGLKHYAHVSSQGADKKSYIMYLRTKGECDHAVVSRFQTTTDDSATPLTSVSIYRPGLLARPDEKRKNRLGERIMNFFMSGIPVATVAKAILAHSAQQATQPEAPPQVKFFQNKEITEVATRFNEV